MTAADIVIRDLGNPAGGGGGWWAARCALCDAWITKYDHSPEDAWRFATAHLREVHGASQFETQMDFKVTA